MDPISCLKEQIKRQLEENQNLRTEIDDSHHNIDTLRGHSKKLKLEESPLNEQQQMEITSSFKSMTSLNGTFSNRVQCEVDEVDRHLRHDDIYLPLVKGQSIKKASCPGCGQQFKTIGRSFEPAYYIHCIKECNDYKNLGMIKRCEDCSKYFINSRSLAGHNCDLPSRPSWMSLPLYIKGLTTNYHSKASCPGCDVLIENATDSKYYSFEFLCHVIEECEDYKKLDRIKECIDCGHKFMNARAHFNHRLFFHKGSDTGHRCNVCNAEFSSSKKLSRHSSISHPNFKPFKCTSCSAMFKWDDDLKRHLKTEVCIKISTNDCN